MRTPTGLRLRRNADVIAAIWPSQRGIEVRTNSLGYRGPELGEKTSPRILFLGDSITEASYLDENDTFVRRVEVVARERGRIWQTINAGVNGTALETYLAILRETGLATKPDVVVVDLYLNDFEESPGVFIPRLPFPLNNSRFLHYLAAESAAGLVSLRQGDRFLGWLKNGQDIEAWREEFAKLSPMREGDYRVVPHALNTVIYKRFYDFGGAWSPHVWQVMQPLFVELIRLSREAGFKPAIVMHPISYQVDAEYLNDYPQSQAKRIAASLGVPFLDLLPALRDAYRGSEKEPLFYDWCHHTPHGAQVVAEQLFHFLDAEVPATH